MRNCFAVVTLCAALSGSAAAQWLDYKNPGMPRTPDGKVNGNAPAPRTPDGKPDFTGLWNRISTKYDANVTADLKPEEIQPWARTLVKERMENLGRDHMFIKCLPVGPGYAVAQRYMKLVQTPALIVMLEEDLVYRQIYMDGRPLEKDPQPAWMGYSVGRWEGDTLVIESAGFNDKTWLDTQGHPHTEALKVRERIRRPDFGHLVNEITFEDPSIYARPWTVKIESLLAPDTQLIENVCLENSKLEHFVGRASDEFKNEKKVAPAILATYVGTYLEQPKYWRTAARVVEFSVEDGILYTDLDGRGKTRLSALSDTNFTGIQGGVDFVAKGAGEAPDMFIRHVSGNYRFARKK